jgi:hypothetical protein
LGFAALGGRRENTIQLLLEAGRKLDAKDINNSSLAWANWYLRPDSILRKPCYGRFSIRPARRSARKRRQRDTARHVPIMLMARRLITHGHGHRRINAITASGATRLPLNQ